MTTTVTATVDGNTYTVPVIIRPAHPIESFEKDIEVIKQTYRMGYEMTSEKIEKIRALWR